MQVLALIVKVIGGINRVVGEVMSWLALVCVLVCFGVVTERYLFHSSTLWMQDLYVWLSGAMFTGVAGFALLRDDHVRVDIFYRPASLKRKAMADLFGVIVFLLPFMFVIFHYGWPAIARSWSYYEASNNVGGMPGLFVLKSFILVFAALVGLQGLAIALRAVLVLADQQDLLPDHLRYQRDADVETAL